MDYIPRSFPCEVSCNCKPSSWYLLRVRREGNSTFNNSYFLLLITSYYHKIYLQTASPAAAEYLTGLALFMCNYYSTTKLIPRRQRCLRMCASGIEKRHWSSMIFSSFASPMIGLGEYTRVQVPKNRTFSSVSRGASSSSHLKHMQSEWQESLYTNEC